jgi:hypothetical protein
MKFGKWFKFINQYKKLFYLYEKLILKLPFIAVGDSTKQNLISHICMKLSGFIME